MDNDKSPEVIEREMQSTRVSLTDKVAALENQVMGTIQTATTAVQDTVQSVKSAVTDTKATVKETVKESIDTVKHAFDVSAQTRENPWAMVGGAAVAGLVTGLLLFRRESSLGITAEAAPRYQPPMGSVPPQPVRSEPRAPGLFDELLARVGTEVRKLAEEALTTCSSSIKQAMQDGVPKLIDQVGEKVTQKVTGGSTEQPHHNGRHPVETAY